MGLKDVDLTLQKWKPNTNSVVTPIILLLMFIYLSNYEATDRFGCQDLNAAPSTKPSPSVRQHQASLHLADLR